MRHTPIPAVEIPLVVLPVSASQSITSQRLDQGIARQVGTFNTDASLY